MFFKNHAAFPAPKILPGEQQNEGPGFHLFEHDALQRRYRHIRRKLKQYKQVDAKLCQRRRSIQRPIMTTRKTSPKKQLQVLQLRIDLAHIKPAIWRRVLVPETITLASK